MNDDLKNSLEKILSQIELPSTRMLLSQQAKLTKLTINQAEISITPNWIGMIETRKSIIEKAIQKTLGGNRDLLFAKQAIIQPEKETLNSRTMASRIQEKPKRVQSKEPNSVEDLNSKKNELNNKETKSFANFFNGEIIDLDDQS